MKGSLRRRKGSEGVWKLFQLQDLGSADLWGVGKEYSCLVVVDWGIHTDSSISITSSLKRYYC